MIINLPYSIPVGKKDNKFYVNLNQYRNAHYHTLNSAKITFKELISDQVKQLPKFNIIKEIVVNNDNTRVGEWKRRTPPVRSKPHVSSAVCPG